MEIKSKTGRSNMVKKLLGAAAMSAMIAAISYAFVPANAATVGVGCSGENLAKTEGSVEGMADGPGKFMAQREIAQAQDALLKDQMRGCAMHLGRAMQAQTLAQAPYAGTPAQPSYANARAEAPAGTATRAQSRSQRTAIKAAQ
jgi:hypothetical protein